jgi:uncharacterized protein (DUF427 family)
MSTAERSTADSGTATAVARAVRNGVVLAEPTRPVLLAVTIRVPPEEVRREYLAATRAWSPCAWAGAARHYPACAGGQANTKAARCYP